MRRGFVLFCCFIWIPLIGSENRIMLVGNSITTGVKSSDGLGFRSKLYEKLTLLKYPFRFVGVESYPPYQGHFRPGAYISEFYRDDRPGGEGTFDVGGDLDQNKPQSVMIHLGTNDIYQGIAVSPYSYDGGLHFSETVSGRLAHLIDYLLEWHNGTRGDHLRTIFISKIIPNGDHPNEVDRYNEEIGRLVADANAGLIPKIPPDIVRLVDQNSSFDTNTMFDPDSIHPNEFGYQHMADVYYNALRFLPMHLVRISNEEQSGYFGNVIEDPLEVKVTDDYGNGVSNTEVRFEVTGGDAILVGSQTGQTDTMGCISRYIQMGSSNMSTIVVHSSGLIDSTVQFIVRAIEHVLVEGQVTYDGNGLPIPDVKIEWIEGKIVADTTDGKGSFRVENLPYGSAVTLCPEKERWSSYSSSTILSYDAALSARYAVGLENLTYQKCLAADVDRDGQVSMNDASHIARYVVGFRLPSGIHIGEWLFYPDMLHYQSLSSNIRSQYISGILSGDLHGGWSDPSLPKMDVDETQFNLLFSSIERDREIAVTLSSEGEGMLSCDLVCEYDSNALWLSSVEKTQETEDFNLCYREDTEGIIHVGLFGMEPQSGEKPILIFHFQILRDVKKITIQLTNLYINDNRLDDATIVVRTDEMAVVSPENYSLRNFPNPFNEETMIRYQIPEDSDVKIQVYNNKGQEVVTLVSKELLKGVYEVQWDGRDQMKRIVPSGVYFYHLSAGDEVLVEKMVKVR